MPSEFHTFPMNSHLLILLLTTSIANSDAVLSKLSQELLTEGLLSLNEKGIPTTVCVISINNGFRRIELCSMTAGFGARSVGCFAVRNGSEVMQQGCYSNQEIALRSQCKKRTCAAGRKHMEISLCCCYGDRCNDV